MIQFDLRASSFQKGAGKPPQLASLKLTASLHLKMDGSNTRYFPVGAFRPIFRGELLVPGKGRYTHTRVDTSLVIDGSIPQRVEATAGSEGKEEKKHRQTTKKASLTLHGILVVA